MAAYRPEPPHRHDFNQGRIQMSIQSAMQAGVAGLFAQSARMAAISDNITNAHTVGYKRSEVSFATMVGGGTTNGYASGGVSANARAEISRSGVLQAGTSDTDMAISGRGFFPLAARLNPGRSEEHTSPLQSLMRT